MTHLIRKNVVVCVLLMPLAETIKEFVNFSMKEKMSGKDFREREYICKKKNIFTESESLPLTCGRISTPNMLTSERIFLFWEKFDLVPFLIYICDIYGKHQRHTPSSF